MVLRLIAGMTEFESDDGSEPIWIARVLKPSSWCECEVEAVLPREDSSPLNESLAGRLNGSRMPLLVALVV